MFEFGKDYDVNQLLADLFALLVKIIAFIKGDDSAFDGVTIFHGLRK